MTEALGRSFASLQIPNFRRYFTGQLVSLSGNWMQMIAEMWLVLSLTGSGVAVGATTALQFLPMLIFGAWGGLIADRVPKRRLLLLTQALHMIAPLTDAHPRARGSAGPLDGLRPRLPARLRQRGRLPDPPGLRHGDGRLATGS